MTREELSELGVNDEAAAVIMQRFADETQAVRDAVQNAFARDAAIEMQIRRAGGRSVRAVRAFLNDKAIVWDEGGLHGLDEQLQAMQNDAETSFLFAADPVSLPGAHGVAPEEGTDETIPGDLSNMSYEELAAVMEP
ncbi:MAG: phage scaffolding protein [Clostridiales bacterium]|nr:phage scaffolding protein [Clostridiales bacterium]